MNGAVFFRTIDQSNVQDRFRNAVSQMTRFHAVRSARRPHTQLPTIPMTADTIPTEVIKVWLSPSTRSSYTDRNGEANHLSARR